MKGRLAGMTTVGSFQSESPWAGITADDRKVALVRTAPMGFNTASRNDGRKNLAELFGH
jgi:hypothetical protein